MPNATAPHRMGGATKNVRRRDTTKKKKVRSATSNVVHEAPDFRVESPGRSALGALHTALEGRTSPDGTQHNDSVRDYVTGETA